MVCTTPPAVKEPGIVISVIVADDPVDETVLVIVTSLLLSSVK
jgi:hypothetical protein